VIGLAVVDAEVLAGFAAKEVEVAFVDEEVPLAALDEEERTTTPGEDESLVVEVTEVMVLLACLVEVEATARDVEVETLVVCEDMSV
jgi:hypothetical protein